MRPIIFVALSVVALAAGCSDSGTTMPPPANSTVPSAPTSPASSAPTAKPDNVVASTDIPSAPTSGAVPTSPATAVLLEPVPETGVPGLDSDDAFCAAWSRFGGTWQVLSVGAAFLDAPSVVAGWEVASSPVVLTASDDLISNFPDELAAERDPALDGYFGAFRQRIEIARSVLDDAGATDDDLAGLSEAWLTALAERDQFDADIGLELSDELQRLVDTAALNLLAQRGPFSSDSTLIVTAVTPATDDYLATQCPDRGALAGQEVDGVDSGG